MPNRRRWLMIGLVLAGAWLALGLLLLASFAAAAPIPAGDAWRLALPFWAPWLLAGPLAVWLAFRFPLEKGRLAWSVPIHLVVCVLLTWGCQRLSRELFQRLAIPTGPPPWVLERFGQGGGPPMGRGFRGAGPANASSAALSVIVYAGIVSACHAVAFFRRARERERHAAEAEALLAQARLSALRMQLNPHFLFNALNAIATLVRSQPREAENMIHDLGELLRASLAQGERQETSLREELDLLRHYLAIEQARFGDRLRIDMNIDPATLEAQVPALILQPLVENAIRHGIEPRRQTGQVSIEARRRDDLLELRVRDNGRGFTPGANGGGIGLENTKSRLAHLYGDRHRFAVHSQDGCEVLVDLPFHAEPASPA